VPYTFDVGAPRGNGAAFQGVELMSFTRAAAVAALVAGVSLLPVREASARCWHNGWGCGPGLLALPFVAAGAAVAVATAPVRAIAGPPYYPAYYGYPSYYGPGYGPGPGYYYPPPGYYYPPPAYGADPGRSTSN
jgi:hypothetical protein